MLKTGCIRAIDGGRSSLYASLPIFLVTVNGPRYLTSIFLEGRLVVMFFDRSKTESPSAKWSGSLDVLYYFAFVRWAFSKLDLAALLMSAHSVSQWLTCRRSSGIGPPSAYDVGGFRN
jgi:hypothetical protein